MNVPPQPVLGLNQKADQGVMEYINEMMYKTIHDTNEMIYKYLVNLGEYRTLYPEQAKTLLDEASIEMIDYIKSVASVYYGQPDASIADDQRLEDLDHHMMEIIKANRSGDVGEDDWLDLDSICADIAKFYFFNIGAKLIDDETKPPGLRSKLIRVERTESYDIVCAFLQTKFKFNYVWFMDH